MAISKSFGSLQDHSKVIFSPKWYLRDLFWESTMASKYTGWPSSFSQTLSVDSIDQDKKRMSYKRM